MFSNKDRLVTFNVDNAEDLSDLSLTFIVEDSEGDLVIELNNNLIYKAPASGSTEINLPLNLVKGTNELLIYSNPVGIKFWGNNFYEVHSVKIRKRVINTTPL